jgi:hypothetical protein
LRTAYGQVLGQDQIDQMQRSDATVAEKAMLEVLRQ